MNTTIDIYCERLEPGLWAEPVNALTNLSFFVAALFAWRLYVRTASIRAAGGGEGAAVAGQGGEKAAVLLIFLIFAMGAGSTLFHVFAEKWAMLADVLPILLYQLVFIYVYTNRVMGLRWYYSAGLLAVFFLIMQGFMQLPREWLNGSLEYAPAWLFLGALALWHYRYARAGRWSLPVAFGVFTLSLTFRSVDMALCEDFPTGTHFAWHILNGLVLYLATRAYVVNT